MPTLDKHLGLWVEIRRDRTYYGVTADDATETADKAEARRTPTKRAPVVVCRWTLLNGVLTQVEK